MDIVDAQLHLGRGKIEATLEAMDALGISAVLIDEYWATGLVHGDPTRIAPGFALPNGAWRATCPVAEEASSVYPDRFSYLLRVDRHDPGLPALMQIIASMPHARAVRVQPVWTMDEARAYADGAYGPLYELADQYRLPVFHFIPGFVELMPRYLRKFPDVTFIVDHTGMAFAGIPSDRPEQDRARVQSPAYFEEVLKLADHPNCALKWAHAQDRFGAQDYPYQPVRGYLHQAVAAFGPERVMWASDTTVVPRHSWSDLLHYVRDDPDLTREQKGWVLGGSVRRLLDWPAPE